ncbi:MAG: hypothetical protein ABI954_01775 [Pyrinomonadaceae bacterium]
MNNALEKTRIGDNDADIAPKVFGFAALGVMAAMFALMGFSMTIIIFLVLVGYFVWRAVAKTEMHEVRGIFEFYLAANEVLRDDERRWYGFEIQDVITRGHRILGMMPDPPPLVHFALGALYHRAGNFAQAENHLAFLIEDEKSDERSRLSASAELRSYVRILRKLEREPAEAPQTTAAIRALERARRHRAAVLLSESRQKAQEAIAAAKQKELAAAATREQPRKPLLERLEEKTVQTTAILPTAAPKVQPFTLLNSNGEVKTANGEAEKKTEPQNGTSDPPKKPRPPKKEKIQKSITEVLRDIYD